MDLWQELRYAARRLRAAPGSTLVAVVTLGLALGANTALFTVTRSLLLKPLAYREAERLVVPIRAFPGGRKSEIVAMSRYVYWRDHSPVFAGTAAFAPLAAGFNLAGLGDGRPERLSGLRVTRDLFALLGFRPALGRPFTAEEDRPGGPAVVMLSNGLWRRRFGADPKILGRSIRLNGQGYEVVGVMSPAFRPPVASELWTSVRLDPAGGVQASYLMVVARLRDGVSRRQALAAMRGIDRQFGAAFPGTLEPQESVALETLQEVFYGDLKTPLFLLLGAVGVVLLIACVNLGNLELARAAGRRREMALRAALGAGTGRLVRQLGLESLLVAALGGAAGVLAARGLVPALLALAPADLPALAPVAIDGGVLAFAAALTLAAGLLFGLAPALAAARPDLGRPLQEGAARATPGRQSALARRFLVAAEVALALALVAAAALLARSFRAVMATDPGFSPARVLTAKLSLPAARYAEPRALERFAGAVTGRVAALPGVRAAAFALTLPTEQGPSFPLILEGRTGGDGRPAAGRAEFRPVSAGFFRALEIPRLAGRGIEAGDDGRAPGVVVLNRTAAAELFPGENPVGRRLTLGPPDLADLADPAPRTVVGVVGDVRERGLDRKARGIAYIPFGQMNPAVTGLFIPLLPVALVVRTAGAPGAALRGVERAVWSVDREQPVTDARPLAQVIGESQGVRRMSAALLAGLALLALLLAAVGIYGVLAYLVGERTREIGVRMALGATRGRVVALVVGQGMAPVLWGAAAGLALSWAAGRLLASLLYEVSATDPATFTLAPAVLVAVALLAIALPAHRASRLEPRRALGGG